MPLQKSIKGDREDDILSMPHARVELLPEAFDILDTTLLQAMESLSLKMPDLSYQREAPASAKSVYRIYLDNLVSEQPVFLGSIVMRKTQPMDTEVVIHRVATGTRALPFEEIVDRWKAYINSDKEVSKLVRERLRGAIEEIKTTNNVPGRRSGRPHLPDDVWAWEQVNRHNRSKKEVYKEWLQKLDADPRRCNMVDPERQFDRIAKPEWGINRG